MPPDLLPALETIVWRDSAVRILDQRCLPRREIYRTLRTPGELRRAIRSLAVRGAPALGIAGSYGVALIIARSLDEGRDPVAAVASQAPRIRDARPTAVNLSYGVRKATARVEQMAAGRASGPALLMSVRKVGDDLLEEDLESSRRMAENGVGLIPKGRPVLTHCNTGGLATAGLGTALAVVRLAAEQGRIPEVLVDETRPLLQGGRLTLWELKRASIPARLLCDGAAAWALRSLKVGCVLVGADRVARNGDTANKVGTLGLALASRATGVPFYVVAPRSSFDPDLPDGLAIPVEERPAREVLRASGWGRAEPVDAFNPAFDVTPADAITAWITDRGVEQPPFQF